MASTSIPDAVFAVNNAACMHLGSIDYLATLHPEHLVRPDHDWIRQRERRGGNRDYQIIAQRRFGQHIGIVFPDLDLKSGTSTLFAVLAALRLGFTRVVVCGAPLDMEPYVGYRQGWIDHFELLRGCCYSMSGWTRELLGEP